MEFDEYDFGDYAACVHMDSGGSYPFRIDKYGPLYVATMPGLNTGLHVADSWIWGPSGESVPSIVFAGTREQMRVFLTARLFRRVWRMDQ